jgi:hypothetical protein
MATVVALAIAIAIAGATLTMLDSSRDRADAYAARRFDYDPGPRTSDSITFLFWVGRYDSGADAGSAAAREGREITEGGGMPVAVLNLNVDGTSWYYAESRSGGVVTRIAYLVFWQDVHVYYWMAHGTVADPVQLLRSTTELVLGPDVRPDPLAAAASLWDHLPDAADLPRGFELVEEWSKGNSGMEAREPGPSIESSPAAPESASDEAATQTSSQHRTRTGR